MTLDFWAKTNGTWINVFTVAMGTTLGLTLKNRLTYEMQQIITQGIGLITIWIGLSMTDSLGEVEAGNLSGVVIGLLAMVIGGITGEWLKIEERLTAVGNYFKKQFRGQGLFTEGFVASSLLFCVGPMTLIGCLNNGLTGDNSLLTIKATMDGIVSIALANIYGIGVGCSVFVVLIYQGILSLAAGIVAANLTNPETNPHILLITGVGGLMIIGIGLNLLEITAIRIASFLPAIALSPLIYHLADFF